MGLVVNRQRKNGHDCAVPRGVAKRGVMPLAIWSALLLSLMGCQKPKSSDQPTRSTNQSAMSNIKDSQSKALTYQEYIEGLVPLTPAELTEKMTNGESFVLYLGRPSCEHCQAFVPKLHQALRTHPKTVYYYDTENRDDAFLKGFRERFHIKTVPNLSYYVGEEQMTTLAHGSQSSLDEIVRILEQLEE